MNYFELYPGDYLRDTTRLTLVEHGAYLRLLLAYYSEEGPLPGNSAEICTITGAASIAERTAVRKVCERYFPMGPDGLFHNARADAEIAKAHERMAREPGRKANQVDRQKRARARRQAIFDQLRAIGIVPNFNATTADLERLVTTCHVPVTRDVTPQVTPPITATTRHMPHEDLKQELPPQTPTLVLDLALVQATAAGSACKAMRAAGVASTNPSHPALLEALAEGITADQLGDYARAAVASGKANPFAYAIAAARGDRRQALAPPPSLPGDPRHEQSDQLHPASRRLSAVERVEANIIRARAQRGELDPIEGTATVGPYRDPVG